MVLAQRKLLKLVSMPPALPTNIYTQHETTILQ
jgi:hypothetical protein